MADLTDQQKREIVEALACFKKPVEIAKAFHEEHGVEIDRLQVGRYDPTRPYFAAGDEWREVFNAARKAYLEDVGSVPIANQGFRLNELRDLYERAKKSGNLVLAAQLLEQSAKEVGGVLTNERNVRVDDSRRQRAADMTPEDRRLAMAELFRQAIEQRAADMAAILPAPQEGA